ncbi:MAG: SGNH/GDSL hydrolase family protein [Eubacteriales bacterium]|nr:SGNH/GDSL hydrolase family protein [Eubacteriales bacterium]
MDDFFFGTPKVNEYKYKKDNFIKPDEISVDYITGKDDNYTYIDARFPIFEIGGIKHPDENGGEYYRLDADKKEKYTDAHKWLAQSTSGGSLRFYTNAENVALKVTYRACNLGMHHFCDRGVYGFDMYIGSGTDRRYTGRQMQTFADDPKENNQVIDLPGEATELLIEFPLYGGIERLSVGLPEGCFISKPAPRKYKPCAFYGSSITQGGCVSRPGNMYSNILCRALDCDNVNLGFSGSAFGELYAAENLASRELSCFVMDYDYNALSLENLESTHLPFYEAVRKGHPAMPIITVSHPCFGEAKEGDTARRDIVKATHDMALSRGDNVYFVDGCDFFPMPHRDLFAVDNLHPNDLGNYYMARAIWPLLSKALKG